MACAGSGQTVLDFLGLTRITCGTCSAEVTVEYGDGHACIEEHDAPSSAAPDVKRLEAENERLRAALVAAREFIEHHPAVSGEWPLLLATINGALTDSEQAVVAR